MSEAPKRIVVIGGVAAGAKAAGRAKRVNPDAQVTLFQDEAEISYTACGQPYYLGGVITDRNALIIQRPKELREKGIQTYMKHSVEEIDLPKSQLSVRDLEKNTVGQFPFDSLIIATGARPITPMIPGMDLREVVTLRSIDELDRFKHALDELIPRRAVILGSGYIGIEVAENLSRLGISVCILEKADRVVPRVDPDIGKIISQHLDDQGIETRLEESALEFEGSDGRVVSVRTDKGDKLDVELVVVAVGIAPNVALAKNAGIKLGASGAIAVDNRMETSARDVYAAGDCAETIHRLTGRPVWNPLGDIANLQGRVAGENAAGGDARFPGVFGTAIFKAFDLNVAMTGLTEQAARDAGMMPISVTINARDRARYYPGAKFITLKLTAEKQSGKILGAQIVGPGAVDKMIDIVGTALLGGLGYQDLENADLAYAPPYSPVISPIIVAAGVLSKKFAK